MSGLRSSLAEEHDNRHASQHDNRHASQHGDGKVSFTLTMEADDRERFLACWQQWRASDRFERQQALRNADLAQGHRSLEHLLRLVLEVNFTCGSSYTIAGVLGSLYNGERVQANLYRLSMLDADTLEHLVQVIRLHCTASCEIHTLVPNGSARFEGMIQAYRLEKRRRKS